MRAGTGAWIPGQAIRQVDGYALEAALEFRMEAFGFRSKIQP